MTGGRADRLDALRGLAVVWMVAFHFCFDLNHFGLWSPVQRFTTDPFWTHQRSTIVTLFLLCAGAGQGLAVLAGQAWPRFWRRWAQVAGCAVLVSLGSWWMFPRSWISFGVLHGVALMLLLVRVSVPWAWQRLGLRLLPGLLVVGALAWGAPRLWTHAVFDSRWGNWTGLVTRLPITEDYVPLLPWLGVVLWGLALGLWLAQQRPTWLQGPVPWLLQPLVGLGRWSLTVYMLHQPVLIGALMAWTRWGPGALPL